MTPRNFVALDRDGTISVEHHYLSDPEQVELLPGSASGLRYLRELGLGLVVITNQSGLGRGYFDIGRLTLIHRRLVELLDAEGVVLDGIYFCPHKPEDDCWCRKPKAGLLELAGKELSFAPRESFVIGDKACDINLGRQVGATTFLVRTGYGGLGVHKIFSPDYVVDDLNAASLVIATLLSTKEKLKVDAKKT